MISIEDIRKLGEITTRDEAGTHFTQKHSADWLKRMSDAGLVEITKPVHEGSGVQYSSEYWTVAVTKKGVELGEAHAWGEEERGMTAREFLAFAGVEETEENLYRLTQYIDSEVDFSQFPDASVNGLGDDAEEPARFQEYLERHGALNEEE